MMQALVLNGGQMKVKLLLYGALIPFLLSGCAGFVSSDINKAMEIRRSSSVDTKKAFDESKVFYIKELRCYAYREDEKKKDIDSILFDAAGKKISNRDEAIEQVKFHYGDKGFSTGEKIALYSTAVWVVPVGFVFGVTENVAMLPALPYALHLRNKFQKEAVDYYQEGQILTAQNHYPEARAKYFLALSGAGSLIYSSDINYQIAETYDKEGNSVLAEKYYRSFLEYSIAQYPDYFQERNPKLANDRAVLDKEFTAAETKLNNVLTSRSSPTL
jgi:hypothetical protein